MKPMLTLLLFSWLAQTPDIHYVPTSNGVAGAMLRLANTTASDVVYDLGSGDGRIVILAAKKFGAHGVGVEIDADLVRQAAKNARKAGVADSVRFLQQDHGASAHPAPRIALLELIHAAHNLFLRFRRVHGK